MGNRHNFESVIQNEKNFDVVSTNQKNFESIINNSHNFEFIIPDGFTVGTYWTIKFEQVSEIIANPILQKNIPIVISMSSSMIAVPKLTQYMFCEMSLSNSVETDWGLTTDISFVEITSAINFESILKQNIKINSVEETIETHKVETEPSYRHYFLLNNYSGSMLDVLDSMLLQDMDYEIV
jgi:heptaprenylglyceryl phosphate synthase